MLRAAGGDSMRRFPQLLLHPPIGIAVTLRPFNLTRNSPIKSPQFFAVIKAGKGPLMALPRGTDAVRGWSELPLAKAAATAIRVLVQLGPGRFSWAGKLHLQLLVYTAGKPLF